MSRQWRYAPCEILNVDTETSHAKPNQCLYFGDNLSLKRSKCPTGDRLTRLALAYKTILKDWTSSTPLAFVPSQPINTLTMRSGRNRPPTPPVSDNGASHTNMNDDENAQRRRQLLEDLKILSSLGKELELPQLVCVGSQSAGKSSLIETLCRITLPRSSGTCTSNGFSRCPIECRSKYVEQPWRGRVLLRMLPEGDEDGDAKEVPFGDAMSDPKEMEVRIAQAQLAVLNSGTDPSTFLAMDPTKIKTKGGSGFTNNSVIVDLAGDGLADLNFVDLPGIIVNVGEGGDPSDIPLVQNMTNCDLLNPCPGVLTKPDRIETPDEAKPWLDMITGKSNRLANGWYCVKQPDSKQRKKNLTWDDARALEIEFFRDTSPWSEVSSKDRLKLGSHNLAYQLGNVLSTALEKRSVNMTELKEYPDPPTQKPSEYILDLLETFHQDVMLKLVDGDPNEIQGVIQSLRSYSLQFRRDIQKAAPVFVKDGASEVEGPKPDFIAQDEEWLSKRSSAGKVWSLKAVESRTGGHDYLEEFCERQMVSRSHIFDHGLLLNLMHTDHCPFAPTKWFMGEVIKDWEAEAIELLNFSYDRFQMELERLVDQHFRHYTAGGLLDVVSGIAHQLLSDCKIQTTEQIKYISDQERFPRTFHEEAYSSRMNLFRKYYSETLNADGPALITMARTRVLYEFAFRRYADAIPMTIDLHFVRTFGRKLHQSLSRGIDVNREEDELLQLLRMADPIVQQRDALMEKGKRLRAARARLST
ncbi:myxovirus resistance 1 [Rhizoctonia solani AG-1 IA]|uniref:Myxovirus resistance 1 n=1 Tax=Thanatephorus cucumeris (strain AG1-IA) TaxID=983506 RepID=L8WIT4_THACA|nr:myxovirus resistance 1 [Rhizoctonia solani AG-1 IA]